MIPCNKIKAHLLLYTLYVFVLQGYDINSYTNSFNSRKMNMNATLKHSLTQPNMAMKNRKDILIHTFFAK